MLWVHNHRVILLSIVLVSFIGVASIRQYLTMPPPSPISVRVWPRSTEQLSEKSSIELGNGEEMAVLYEHDSEHSKLGLERITESENTSWKKTLATSDIPLTYSVSYDEDNMILIHVNACKNHLYRMRVEYDNGVPDLASHVVIMPDTVFSRVIPINHLVYNLQSTGYAVSHNICVMLINVSGDIVDIQYNTSIQCGATDDYTYYKIEQVPMNNGSQNLVLTKNTTGTGRIWSIDFLGIGVEDIVGIHCSTDDRTVILARVADTLFIPGEASIEIPQELRFEQYYIAMLAFDDYGHTLWYSLAGPFYIGSEGTAVSYANREGEVFLIATYADKVDYWKNNARQLALNARRRQISNAYHGLNHGQALLVVDSDGELRFSGKLADGYLVPPFIIHTMPDNALGLYAQTSPRARLLNSDQIYFIHDNFPLPSHHVFMEIPADSWGAFDRRNWNKRGQSPI